MCQDGWGTLEEIAAHGSISLHVDVDAIVNWAHNAYALTDDSWDPAGAGDPNDGTLPYGKVLTSIFLITYALRDDYIPQWHSTEDYVSCSRAADNRFHGPFYMRFIEYDGTSEGDAQTGRFEPDVQISASGSWTRRHAFAHGSLHPRAVRRTRP